MTSAQPVGRTVSDGCWLGELPSNWRVQRLKYVASISPSSVDKKMYDGQLKVRLCNYTDVYYNDQITGDMDLMVATATDDEVRRFTLRAGQVIITKDSESAADIGIAAYVPEDLPGVVCGYHLSIIQPNQGVDGRFIKRLFDSAYVKSLLATRANGLTRVGLGQGALSSIQIPVPPVAEQSQIANYLDAQTAKIDALIGKQERLIETLAERRQVVISHAVTKGLDPDTPVKDSEVEWLGAVPSHWTVTAMKWILSIPITDGPHETPEFLDEGIPFVSAEAVSSGVIRFDKVRGYISASENARFSRKYSPKRDDIYVVKSGATTGVAAIVDTDAVFNIWSPLAAIRARPGVIPRFLLNFIRSREFQAALELNWSYGTQQNIGMGTLGQLPVALPPEREQEAIVEHLNRETSQIGALDAKARAMIDVLKERRQALISAAVTGKIDVRGLA